MMKSTRLMLLDYNVTRFHSFDLFSYLLLNEERFYDTIDELKPFREIPGLMDKIDFLRNTATSFNPYEYFNTVPDDKILALKNGLNDLFNSKLEHRIPTDLSTRMHVVMQNNNITSYIVQHKADKHEPQVPNTAKLVKVDDLFDFDKLITFINQYGINAIMVDSVDTAAYLATKLTAYPISFIIANYRYNFENSDKTSKLFLHGLKMLNLLEFKYKHEFGLFDPYTGITEARRLERLANPNMTINEE